MLPRLEAAVGRPSGLECPEHTGTTCLPLGFLATPPPELQYLLENIPSIVSASLWSSGPEEPTVHCPWGCSPRQFLWSQARVKPAGQEQEKWPGALWQACEQGLGPAEHSFLSGLGDI